MIYNRRTARAASVLPTFMVGLGLGANVKGSKPVFSAAPSITGTARVGQVLTAVAGTVTGATSTSYQWNSAGVPISGATSTTYTVQSSDLGNTITVTETATNSTGSATSTSSPTATVVAANDWSFVQGATNSATGTNLTVTATFPSTVAAGDLILLVATGATSSVALTGVTDTIGNTYASAVAESNALGTVAIWWAISSAGGTNTVTATFNAAGLPLSTIAVLEYANTAGVKAVPVDGTGTGVGNSATPVTTAVAVTGTVELLVSAFATKSASSSFTAGGGAALRESVTSGVAAANMGLYVQDMLSVSTTTTPTGTFGAASLYVAAAASFLHN